MKRILLLAGLALVASISIASAQRSNTGRESYDNPTHYDRDARGNETGYRRNTYFGPTYYYDDEDRPVRRSKKIAKKRQQQYYDDDD